LRFEIQGPPPNAGAPEKRHNTAAIYLGPHNVAYPIPGSQCIFAAVVHWCKILHLPGVLLPYLTRIKNQQCVIAYQWRGYLKKIVLHLQPPGQIYRYMVESFGKQVMKPISNIRKEPAVEMKVMQNCLRKESAFGDMMAVSIDGVRLIEVSSI